MLDAAKSWAEGVADRANFEVILAEGEAVEEFHAYAGPRLMAASRERVAAGDANGTATLTRRISAALLTRSFRRADADLDSPDDAEMVVADVLPPSLGRHESRRPYFEVLIVTGAPASVWPIRQNAAALAEEPSSRKPASLWPRPRQAWRQPG
jgi:arginine decarboxylase